VPLAEALDRALGRSPVRFGPAIAIRPLSIAADDAELAALSTWLCRSVASRLAGLGGLRVTACDSTEAAVAAGLDDHRLARLLAVDHLLVGQLQRRPDGRLRVGFELLEVTGQRSRWRVQLDPGPAELQALPQQVAQGTGAALSLGGSAAGDAPISPAAFERYLQAQRQAARGSPADQREALRLVDEVLALEPDHLPALVSQLQLRSVALRFPTAEERADPAAQRLAQQQHMKDAAALGQQLLAQGRDDRRGHVLLANLAVQQRRWVDGFRHLDRVLAQPLTDASSLRTAAHLHAMAGYRQRALELALAAARLDPLNAVNHQAVAFFNGLLGDTAAMREHARIAQELGDRMAVVYNGIAALRERDWALAEAATVEGLRGAGVEHGWVHAFVRGAADAAERESASRTLDALPAALQHGMARFHWYHGWLGNTERSLRAVHDNLASPIGPWLSNLWWPELDHLRRAPGFAAVLADAQLPALWLARGAPDLCRRDASGSWSCR
jgi:TolB-like protein